MKLPTLDAIEREIARRSLLDFSCYIMPNYDASWHHAVLCDYLDRLLKGDINRLMVTMPPRHGKSQLVSRHFPAYVFGRNPDEQIIACSYSADLASRMNRDTQRIIDSEAYRELFPNSQLYGKNIKTVAHGSYLRNSEIFEIVGHKGAYRSAGVMGGITGMGCTIGIIDDPVKNQDEAESETYRNKLWDWYTSTFFTRLEKNARILLVMTRWHEDDLGGRILNAMKKKDGDKWHVVNFPAIRENLTNKEDPRAIGEALWKNKYDKKDLAVIETTVGPRVWSSLYQQDPAPDKGGMFPKHKWRYLNEPPIDIVAKCRYWDRASSEKQSSDYTVGVLIGRDIKGSYYVLDVIRFHGGPGQVEQTIYNTAISDGDETIIGFEVDPAQAGSFEKYTYAKTLSGFDVRFVPARDNKVIRARPLSTQVDAGNVYLLKRDWNEQYITEMQSFPFGKNDDQVDGSSGAYRIVALNIAIDNIDLMASSDKEIQWAI